MSLSARIESAISAALSLAVKEPAPRKLAQALDHAVNPGGARIRPTISLSVAKACGDDKPNLSNAACAAIELIHCASLVHDDLPCFDNADLRRGKPTVHIAYSQPIAVLAGDTLIVLAFEVLARAAVDDPQRAVEMIKILSQATGMPNGICAGQGWESEDKIDLSAYHRSKTGALFVAATKMGAAAAGKIPSLGQNWALGLARRSKLPMICVTRFTMKKPWVSPWVRTISTGDLMLFHNWACAAPFRGWRIFYLARLPRFRLVRVKRRTKTT